MPGFDARLWRVLNRILLMLTVGVLGLLLGLGSAPGRVDSLFGVLILGVVALPVWATVRTMPPTARQALTRLPRHRPLLAVAAGMLACVALMITWWAVANLVAPGTLAPLSLALVVLAATAAVSLTAKLARSR